MHAMSLQLLLICLAYYVTLMIAAPLVIPLEPITAGEVNQFFVPIQVGSSKQRVLLTPVPWAVGHTINHKDTCPIPVLVVSDTDCAAYMGQLFDPEASTTFVGNLSRYPDVPANDSFQFGGATLPRVNFTLHGANRVCQGSRGNLPGEVWAGLDFQIFPRYGTRWRVPRT